MSKKANPTTIGIFIFVGILLGVGGLLLFTSSKLFARTAEFIVYFDSSLNGLKEGAPVKYRGVTIGSVSRVMIHFNQATNDTAMPVIFQVQEDLIRQRLVGATSFTSIENLGEEVHKSLRAQLEIESLVTGVLYISLEIENSPPPAIYHQVEKVYPEIPSRPTEIQQLMKNLASLDLAGLEHKISGLVTRLDGVVTSLKMDEIIGSVTNVLGSVNRVVTTPDLTNSFTSLRTTLDQYRVLGEKVSNRVDPLADGITNTLDHLNSTLVQARGSMRNLREVLAPDSPLRNDLSLALDHLAEASQSVAALAEFLQDHPNALITGRRILPQKP